MPRSLEMTANVVAETKKGAVLPIVIPASHLIFILFGLLLVKYCYIIQLRQYLTFPVEAFQDDHLVYDFLNFVDISSDLASESVTLMNRRRLDPPSGMFTWTK